MCLCRKQGKEISWLNYIFDTADYIFYGLIQY